MRSYETARSLYSFLGFCATAVIVLGVIVAFAGGAATQALGRNAGAMQFIMGALPGLMIALAGTYGQAMVQMGRTGVDTAEYAQQSLEISRQQLEISKQALAQGRTIAASYPVTPAPPAVPVEEPSSTAASYQDEPTSTPVDTPDALPPDSAENVIEPVTSAPPQIIHQNGRYHVGKRAFKTAEAAEAYAGQLGVNPRAMGGLATYDIGGRKLTQNPDGTLLLDGRSFASVEAVKEHLQLVSSSSQAARKSL